MHWLRELLCRSCVQCKTCHNKAIDASPILGWWLPAIVTPTTTRVSPPSVHVHARKDKSASNVGGKSLKSAKESKITTTFLFSQLWPHSFLSLTNARRDIKYDDLTLEEFVAGNGQILQSPDIEEIERSARLKHLVSLMYFAQQYEWQPVFTGLFFWRSSEFSSSGVIQSLFHIESRTLYGHPKTPKSSTSGGSSTSSTTVLYCRDFQRQQCFFPPFIYFTFILYYKI